MIPLLILLHLSVPAMIEQSIDRTIGNDSISAHQALLLPFRVEIEAAAAREALPAALLAAVIQEESQFDPWATRAEPKYLRSRAVRRAAQRFVRIHRIGPTLFTEIVDRSRSYGLMQVMGETAREQGFERPFLAELYIPQNAIAHGAMLLKRLLLRYHNDTLAAISAYNQGTAHKRRGVFLNARYVYRVTIAWRAYDTFFKNGARTP